MKSRFLTLVRLLILALTAAYCGVYANAYAASGNTPLYVQVKESKLRSKPEFWASSVATLNYGAVLTPTGSASGDKSWVKVKYEDKEGFVHITAVTKRKVILSSSTQGVQTNVDQNSIVMAGKGFNRQVENSYAAKKGLDFKAVDQVEQHKVDSEAEAAFIQQGKLS